MTTAQRVRTLVLPDHASQITEEAERAISQAKYALKEARVYYGQWPRVDGDEADLVNSPNAIHWGSLSPELATTMLLSYRKLKQAEASLRNFRAIHRATKITQEHKGTLALQMAVKCLLGLPGWAGVQRLYAPVPPPLFLSGPIASRLCRRAHRTKKTMRQQQEESLRFPEGLRMHPIAQMAWPQIKRLLLDPLSGPLATSRRFEAQWTRWNCTVFRIAEGGYDLPLQELLPPGAHYG